jgi:hypothetical protein
VLLNSVGVMGVISERFSPLCLWRGYPASFSLGVDNLQLLGTGSWVGGISPFRLKELAGWILLV